jgi:hypothetical protein
MSNAWPAIQRPNYPLVEDLRFPQVKTEFENGAVQQRPKWTSPKATFSLSWAAMSATDYATLRAFFIANQGLSIAWTHPDTSVAYVVRFGQDSLKSSIAMHSLRKVEITLEEV